MFCTNCHKIAMNYWVRTVGGNTSIQEKSMLEVEFSMLHRHLIFSFVLFLKKNQTTPRPSEHPPVMGGKMPKSLGGIKRLQIQNHYMAFKQVPRCR